MLTKTNHPWGKPRLPEDRSLVKSMSKPQQWCEQVMQRIVWNGKTKTLADSSLEVYCGGRQGDST